jgi:hypothetical protein
MIYEVGDKFKDIGGYEHTVTEVTMDMGSRLDTYYFIYKTEFKLDNGVIDTEMFIDEIDYKEVTSWG